MPPTRPHRPAAIERLIERAARERYGVVPGPVTPERTTDVVVRELLGHRVEALGCFGRLRDRSANIGGLRGGAVWDDAPMTVSKLDAVTAAAADLARAAAEEAADAAGDFGVGDHLGVVAEGERVVTHAFSCPHPGYLGWHWAVTLVRATRAKAPTVNEVVLLPGDEALLAPAWVPWAERIGPGDLAPGMLLPLGDNDPRIVPGYTGGTEIDDDAVAIRGVVHELGLGRERLLSDLGRTAAASRWVEGDGGPDAPQSKLAPAPCGTCAFFIRLRGSLGGAFGACANEKSPSDGRVVSIEHGCGAHSDVVAEAAAPLPDALWDTLSDETSLFD